MVCLVRFAAGRSTALRAHFVSSAPRGALLLWVGGIVFSMASRLRAAIGWDDKDRGDRSFSVLSVLTSKKARPKRLY